MSYDDIQYPSGFGLQDVVSYGSTGLVVLDAASNTVIKKPLDPAFARYVDIERQIYERLIQKGGHEGILSYHGVVEDGIRLEHASNYDLKSFISDNVQFPEQRLHWVVQIAETVDFIHRCGVIHGDLSSANVFLDADLNVKVADFAGSSLDRSPLLIDEMVMRFGTCTRKRRFLILPLWVALAASLRNAGTGNIADAVLCFAI